MMGDGYLEAIQDQYINVKRLFLGFMEFSFILCGSVMNAGRSIAGKFFFIEIVILMQFIIGKKHHYLD